MTALESFGDILIRNQKYKYAILAYEAAITAHKIKEKRDYDKVPRPSALALCYCRNRGVRKLHMRPKFTFRPFFSSPTTLIYSQLNRRLCGITLQHRDLQRSLSYHLKVLQSSRMERNINEFVFVSEVLSKIQLEQGMFTAAGKQEYLAKPPR